MTSSKASYQGHPLHPMLVPFPLAFFILAFVSDCIYELDWGDERYIDFSFFLIAAGLVMAAVAALPALVDMWFIQEKRLHDTAAAHALTNVVVLILELINIGMRARRFDHYWHDGWIMSLISVLLLAISGWLGQKLVYVQGQAVEPVESYQGNERQRLA